MAGGVKSYIRSLVRENEQKSEHVKDGRAQTQGKKKSRRDLVRQKFLLLLRPPFAFSLVSTSFEPELGSSVTLKVWRLATFNLKMV